MRTRAELWGGRRPGRGRLRVCTGQHRRAPRGPVTGTAERQSAPATAQTPGPALPCAGSRDHRVGQVLAARARSWQEPHGRLFLPDRELPAQQRHGAQGGLRPPGECVVSPEPVAPGSPRPPAPRGRPKSRAPPPAPSSTAGTKTREESDLRHRPAQDASGTASALTPFGVFGASLEKPTKTQQ